MIGGFVAGLLAAASGTSASYGEDLLDWMHLRHPEISSAAIEVTDNQGRHFASSRQWSARSRVRETRVLADANGNPIGTVALASPCPNISKADEVVEELSRRIYSPASLAEPDPFIAGAVRAPTGQALIDDALKRDPDIITLAFHVTAPRGTINRIAASSFGRIGKPADADDQAIIEQNKLVREVTNGGKRLAVELPLLDASGRTIGALSTSFKMTSGANPDEIQQRAVLLRDSLARETPSLKALFRPVTASRQVRSLPRCQSRDVGER